MRRALCLAALLGLLSPAGHAETACPDVAPPALRLPVTQAAWTRHEPIVVVALGSSSTAGAAATDPAHSYPAILQAELARLLPGAHVAVLNRGIGGEDATEQIARLGRDAIAARPHLVIWQVGANGALRDADPAAFRATVSAGVRRLHQAGIDVVLMDNQRAPRILAKPNRLAIEAALVQAARETGAGLFSRGALMDAWAQAGTAPAELLAHDNLHHNNRGYRCIGETLARGIAAAMSQTAK
jgi:lysophospholipase L1-like esterase